MRKARRMPKKKKKGGKKDATLVEQVIYPLISKIEDIESSLNGAESDFMEALGESQSAISECRSLLELLKESEDLEARLKKMMELAGRIKQK